MPEKVSIGEFLAAHGGPFYELQLRLGLLHENTLRSVRRAAIFVGLAWGVPFLLSLTEGTLLGISGRSFLLDPGIWARFFVAVGLFVLAERQVEPLLRAILNQFRQAPLLAPISFAEAAKIVATSLRRRDSAVAEIVCLALAIAASVASLMNLAGIYGDSWAIRSSTSGHTLTLAAWWCLLVSSPIFWFLLLRGLWRHLVWALLLYDLSRQELRLVVTHPDGKAGLAFIGRYPNAYAIFIFGVSCVVGAILARQLQDDALALATYGYVMGAWLIIVFALFVVPLTAFAVPLAKLKEQVLAVSGAQATQALRLAERKLLGRNVSVPDASEAQTDAADPSKHYEAARKLSIFLLSRSSLVPLAAAAVLPLAAAGATKLPYKELFSIVKKLLLL